MPFLFFAKGEDNEKLNGKLLLYHGEFYQKFVFKKSTIFQVSTVINFQSSTMVTGCRYVVSQIQWPGPSAYKKWIVPIFLISSVALYWDMENVWQGADPP